MILWICMQQWNYCKEIPRPTTVWMYKTRQTEWGFQLPSPQLVSEWTPDFKHQHNGASCGLFNRDSVTPAVHSLRVFWVFFCWSRMEPTHLLRFKRRSMKAWYFFGTCFALMLMVSCSKSKTRIGRLDLYRDRILEIFELLVGECMPSDKKTASCDFSDSKGVKQKQPFFLSPSAWYVKGAPIEVQYVETVCKHYYQGAPIEFHMPYLLSKVGTKTLSVNFLRIVWSRTHAAFGWSGLLAARLEWSPDNLTTAQVSRPQHGGCCCCTGLPDLWHGVSVGFNVFFELSFTRVTGASVNICLFASCLLQVDRLINPGIFKLEEGHWKAHLSCLKLWNFKIIIVTMCLSCVYHEFTETITWDVWK